MRCYRVFIKYCVFSLKFCDFSELCQFWCCSAGVLPAWCVYTRWHRGKTESGIFLKFRKKTQYLMNTLYLWANRNNVLVPLKPSILTHITQSKFFVPILKLSNSCVANIFVIISSLSPCPLHSSSPPIYPLPLLLSSILPTYYPQSPPVIVQISERILHMSHLFYLSLPLPLHGL